MEEKVKMASLVHKDSGKVLAQNLVSAQSFWARMKGLMGKKDMDTSSALWIYPCLGSIHTCFMRFPIDVIFVNKSLAIVRVIQNISPWKWIYPLALFSNTHSVFEFKSPALAEYNLKTKDLLHVGD